MPPPAEADSMAGSLAILFIILVCYMLPTVIAVLRKAASVGLICVVNLFLGWTVVGWFICLIWGALAQTKAQQAFYENATAMRPRP